MISICMATQNGAAYIKGQLDSILPQLDPTSEIIISDDCSDDNTVDIVQSYGDSRIKFNKNEYKKGILKNFESSLRRCKGDHIFLADQDDIWLPNKIEVMLTYLQRHDLVICNCLLVDHNLNSHAGSFFEFNNSRTGLLKNIYKNSYMGCCMAFNRNLLERSLPFPDRIPMHDLWLGLMAELYFNVKFIPDVLVHHRLHRHNASATGRKSKDSLHAKIAARFYTLKHILSHRSVS